MQKREKFQTQQWSEGQNKQLIICFQDTLNIRTKRLIENDTVLRLSEESSAATALCVCVCVCVCVLFYERNSLGRVACVFCECVCLWAINTGGTLLRLQGGGKHLMAALRSSPVLTACITNHFKASTVILEYSSSHKGEDTSSSPFSYRLCPPRAVEFIPAHWRRGAFQQD